MMQSQVYFNSLYLLQKQSQRYKPLQMGPPLFFAHPFSVTMWDVQTGGLIHTFTTQSEIKDIAVSTSGDYIACGSSDGSVGSGIPHQKGGQMFWERSTSCNHLLVASPQKLAVATQSSLCITPPLLVKLWIASPFLIICGEWFIWRIRMNFWWEPRPGHRGRPGTVLSRDHQVSIQNHPRKGGRR
jgi:WD40 repeat protein